MFNAPLETPSWDRLSDGFAAPPAESHRPMIESLEARLLLSADVLTAAMPGDGALAGVAEIHKLMVAGDPNGTPADSPELRIDANTTDSPYAGVGSLRVDATGFDGYIYIGSGALLDSTHVLTAAHMFDLDDNGTIDVAPGDVTFNLNYDGDLSHMITASALYIHPDFTGFGNPSINDDVAVIELSTPVSPIGSAGVPTYALNTDPFVNIETVTLVGYGLSGDGVNGYDYELGTSLSIKRVGQNRAEVYISDDEGTGSREGWQLDFDGVIKKTNLYGPPKAPNLTLGNDIETTLGGGDSGGPAFIDDGSGGLEIFGINTFGFGSKAPAPLFGSGAGGIVVATYADWIQSILDNVPPPPPTPGITVTPTSGLETSEAGGSATFTVVLNTQPGADVTIALSSKDTSEGIIDEASLTFRTTNWNAPQTVTVTGVDDAILDGDMAYTIITDAASSGDTDYDGIDAADVSVTNLDDEVAPVTETLAITKATYSSRKVELKVEATSSLGGGTDLVATFFVGGVESATKAMSYKKGKWSVTFKSADGLGGTKPQKVMVYSTSGAFVEKTDVDGKSTATATAYAMHVADTAPEGITDSPVLLSWAGSTPISAAARPRADVAVALTVAEMPLLAVYSATTGSQESPLHSADLASGAFEDAPAGDESAGQTDLDLPLAAELMDELTLPL